MLDGIFYLIIFIEFFMEKYSNPRRSQYFPSTSFRMHSSHYNDSSYLSSKPHRRDFNEFESSTHPPKYKDRSFHAGLTLRPPKWDLSRLHPIKKSIYSEHPSVTSRDDLSIDKFKADFNICVKGHRILRPILSFLECSFPEDIFKMLSIHFPSPTPIQSQAWPVALSGLDLVGIARTGSGKTLAYLLPGLVHIKEQSNITKYAEPRLLILTPTRELAIQVQLVCSEYGSVLKIRSTCVYGGSSKGNQIRELDRGCDIVVATPGRLLDLLENRKIFLDKVSFCVLDEADRMLDMGFEPQIRKIMEQLRPDRQTLMWSATWPKEVKGLAEDFLSNYIQINVGSIELSANHNIKQNVELCEEYEKNNKLLDLLKRIIKGKSNKTIIFCETKRKVKSIAIWLQRMGFYVDCIHGDKEQYARENVLSAFRQGKISILVATDVASRGLDIHGIEYIINFDFPNIPEDYIHRIGRTARADNSGTAFTYFTPQNYKHSKDLIRILQEANQEVPRGLLSIGDRSSRFNPRKRGRDTDFRPSKFSKVSSSYKNGSNYSQNPSTINENVGYVNPSENLKYPKDNYMFPIQQHYNPPPIPLNIPISRSNMPTFSTKNDSDWNELIPVPTCHISPNSQNVGANIVHTDLSQFSNYPVPNVQLTYQNTSNNPINSHTY